MMEVYLGDDEIARQAKVADLENALAAVKAMDGRVDLCVQVSEKGPHVILEVMKVAPTAYSVDYYRHGRYRHFLFHEWKEAADCVRRFFAGRHPIPGELP